MQERRSLDNQYSTEGMALNSGGFQPITRLAKGNISWPTRRRTLLGRIGGAIYVRRVGSGPSNILLTTPPSSLRISDSPHHVNRKLCFLNHSHSSSSQSSSPSPFSLPHPVSHSPFHFSLRGPRCKASPQPSIPPLKHNHR